MSGVKKPKQKKVTIGGIEFTFQFPGVKTALEISDRSRDRNGNLLTVPYYEQIMEHVIVNPRTDWDFWDDNVDIVEEVFGQAIRFLNNPR